MPETESNDSTVGDLLATFVQAADPMLAADLRAAAAMTPQHPAAPETESDANGLTEAEREALSNTVRDVIGRSYGFEAICRQVERIVAERVRVVEGERDAAATLRAVAAVTPCACSAQRARAESAEAAHEAEKAAHERLRAEFSELADDFASNIDWSAGRGNYGDNEAWERAAILTRALLGGGEAR